MRVKLAEDPEAYAARLIKPAAVKTEPANYCLATNDSNPLSAAQQRRTGHGRQSTNRSCMGAVSGFCCSESASRSIPMRLHFLILKSDFTDRQSIRVTRLFPCTRATQAKRKAGTVRDVGRPGKVRFNNPMMQQYQPRFGGVLCLRVSSLGWIPVWIPRPLHE